LGQNSDGQSYLQLGENTAMVRYNTSFAHALALTLNASLFCLPTSWEHHLLKYASFLPTGLDLSFTNSL
jgi:hypothetical protein